MDFKDLALKKLSPDETDELLKLQSDTMIPDGILPQPSLDGNSPRAMPNFSNAQSQSVIDMNNLFKNTPAYDPRVQPQDPDQFDMEPMTIESNVPKIEKLKSLLQKKQQILPSNPQPQGVKQITLPLKEEAKPEWDSLLAGQGMSKILQGIAQTQGGKIDDNSDFYNRYRQYLSEKPQRDIENKVKQRNLERMTKMDDPNSQESKTFRKTLEASIPGIVANMKKAGVNFDTIAANDKDNILDFARLRENADARVEAARLGALNRQDALAERKREFETRIEDKKAQQQKLSEKQVKDLTSYDQGIALLSNIEATKSQFDTGPLSSRQNAAAQMFGMDDAQKSAFKADVQSNVAEYIKSISGAAVSDTERKYLLQNMPNMTDNDATFSAKLKKVKDRLERNRDLFLNNVKASGKNTSEFEQEQKDLPKKSEKADKSKPKTVIQGGHTYTLNEETGNYE